MFNYIKKFSFNFNDFFIKSKKIKNKSFIVFFHGVEEKVIDPNTQSVQITFKNFKETINYLSSNFDILPFSDLIKIKNNGENINNKISITFDDGYKNNFEVAYPFLKKEKIPFLIYLTTNFISSKKRMPTFLLRLYFNYTKKKFFYSNFFKEEFDISTKKKKEKALHQYIHFLKNFEYTYIKFLLEDIDILLSASERKNLFEIFKSEEFLEWEDIKKMQDLCEFGSHTKDHFIFNEKNFNNAEEQLLNSKKIIDDHIGKCNHFALPNGNRNIFIENFLMKKKFPYESIATTQKKFISPRNELFVSRMGVDNIDSLNQLKYDLWNNA